jgi:hypothetical protein
MADDVKVKFSGDFTDVPKGASEAASRAGSAMKSWAGDFGKSLAGSFVGLFAADAVIGAIKDFASGVREQLTYFRELQHTIEKTNVDAKEFQQIASYAKENGIAMETMGKGMAFANVYLGKVKSGSREARDELRALKFTEEEINSGRINSIDILKRLADAYQIEGQREQVAEHLKKVYGRGGLEMIPLLERGSSGITEAMGEAKTYSPLEIRAAANLDKIIRKLEKKKTDLQRRTAAYVAMKEFEGETEAANLKAKKDLAEENQIEGTSGLYKRRKSRSLIAGTEGENTEKLREYLSTEKGQKEYAEKLRSQYKAAGLDEDLAVVMAQKEYDENKKKIEQDKRAGKDTKFAEQSLAILQGILNQFAGVEKPKGVEIGAADQNAASGVAALSASSLQAIGGGDIASVLAGTSPMDMTAENTRQANIYLKTIAENKPVEQVDGTAAH